MDNLHLYVKSVEIAEELENGNLRLRFILCDFNPNGNGTRLNRDTIETWMGTIINQPLVGKIRANGKDFMGHEMKIVNRMNSETGEVEKEVRFDTVAVGTFYNVEIITIDETEYLTADAEIWARYPRVIELIAKRIHSENGLHTSWEILTLESHQEDGIKVIDRGAFIGHCLLGEDFAPAYKCSGYLEAATLFTYPDDEELYEAIASDIASQKENDMKNNKVKDGEAVPALENAEGKNPIDTSSEGQPTVLDEPGTAPTDTPDVSALTDRDVRRKLQEQMVSRHEGKWYELTFIYPADCTALFHDYADSEMSFVKVVYTIEENDVTIQEESDVTLQASIVDFNAQMALKDEALVKANETIRRLEEENAAMLPFKAEAERMERERLEAEKAQKVDALREYAAKSGLISAEEMDGDGDIAALISDGNEAEIKRIIAERFMASLDQKEDGTGNAPEVSSMAHESAILIEDNGNVQVNPISLYLNN